MNRRPGRVNVTTEVAYCSFCGRPRNLRREEHQLGALLRTIVTCETCHRTLSSTVGVAQAEPEPAKAPAAAPSEPAEEKPAARRPAAKKPVRATAPARPAAAAKAKKPATAAKATKPATTRRSTTTRPPSRKK